MAENRVDDDSDAGGDHTTAVLLEAVVSTDHMINSLMAMRAGLIATLHATCVEAAPALDRADGADGADGAASRPDLTSSEARASALADLRRDLDLRVLTAEIACALRVPHTTAAHLIDDAHVLATALPATATALASGAITYRHAQAMVNHISALKPTARPRAESTLIPRAKVLTVSAFTRAVTRERDRLDPVPLVERHARAATGRTILLEGDIDGMAWLHAHLPATTATAIFHRLSDAAATVAHPGDPRTLPQLRADTLSALLLDDDARDALQHALHPESTASTASTASTSGTDASGCVRGAHDDPEESAESEEPEKVEGSRESEESARLQALRATLRGIRPTVAVTVPVMTLLGGDAPAELEGYGPIDPETARALCAAAPSFLRILTHPHTGAILGVDRDRYTVPADLKAWLRLRDATCRFPGCNRRAQRCDIDHVTDWAHGGATTHTNLIHLCRAHHRLKHRTAWTAQIITDPPESPGRHDAAGPDRPTNPDGTTGRTRPTEKARPPRPVRSTEPERRTGPESLNDPARTDRRLPSTGPRSARVRWTAPSGRIYTTDDAIRDRAGPPAEPLIEPSPAPRTEAPARFPDIPPF